MNKLSFRKFSIIMLSLLVALSSFVVARGFFTSKADVQNEFVYKLSAEVESEYLRDSYFNIPVLTVNYGGKDYNSTAKLFYPDNRESTNLNNYLDVEGVYTLRYTFSVLNTIYTKDYNFTVIVGVSSLFSSSQASFSVNQTTPSYMVTDKEYCGLGVSSTSNNIVVTYNTPIDLTDNTREDILLEFMPTPVTEGVPETNAFIIKLTDIYDSDNWVKIRVCHLAQQDYFQVWAGANFKYGLAGYDPFNMIGRNPWNQYSGNGGLTAGFGIGSTPKKLCANSYGKRTGYNMCSVKLHFDYLEKSLYGTPSELNNDIVDLDDVSQVGVGNQWNGFTSGKAYLSIETALSSSSLNYLILNVDGNDLSNYKVEDKTAPEIQVDLAGNTIDNLPYGIVNKPYKIFDAVSVDDLDKISYAPSVRVYEKATYKNAVISDNVFVPKKAGEYVIQYKAQDFNGNSTVKEIPIVVKNSYDSQISYEFNSNLETSTLVGNTFQILEGYPSGGSGVLDVKYSILKGDALVDNVTDSYKFTELGEFTLRATVTDYLGTVAKFDQAITVLANAYPSFDMPFITDNFIAGNTYYLPEVTAYEYSSLLSGEAVSVDVYADGVKLTDNCFNPTVAGQVTLTYKAVSKYDGTKTTEYSKVVNVVKPAGSTFLTDYFYCSDQVTKTAGTEYITFNTSSDQTVSFINFLGLEGFTLDFNVNGNKNNFEKISFYLTDANNPLLKIKFSIGKADVTGAKTSKLYINDVYTSPVSGSFFGNVVGTFNLSMEQADGVFSIRDNTAGEIVAEVNKTVNGATFNGFESDTVYMYFTFEGVTGESELFMYSICNQMLNRFHGIDKTSPYIVLKGEVKTDYQVALGETVVFPKAVAFDVLTVNPELKLMVVDPDGNCLFDDVLVDDFTFVAEKYGTYSISYYAQDSSGKKNEVYIPYSCKVVDKIDPTINLDEESIPKTVYVNSIYTLPKVTIKDNVSGKVYSSIAIYCPNGAVIQVKGNEFKLTQKGNHTLVYFACDEAGNTVTKTFVISAV